MRKSPLWRIAPYVRPFWPALTVMFVSALGAQVIGAFLPILIQRVIDDAVTNGDRDSLKMFVTWLVVLGVLEGFLLGLRRYVLAPSASLMEMRLRHDLYSHLQRLSLGFHSEWQSGQLLSRAMTDTNKIFREWVSWAAIFFVANIVTFAVVMVLLARLNAVMAALTCVAAIPIAITAIGFKNKFRVASRRRQDSEGDLGTYVEEAALGMRVITTFGRTDVTDAQFDERATETRSAALAANLLKARFNATLSLVSDLALAAVLGGGAIAVANGSLTVGGLVAFLSLLLMLMWPVRSFGEILAVTHDSSVGAERIFEVFDSDPEITDAPNAKTLKKVEGRVEIIDAHFGYPGKQVLSGLSLSVEPGETLAIVGRTGSGKTTLCALIPRLIDLDSGSVRIDGNDVREIALSSLRENVAVAFEDPLLFSASVRENLLLGRDESNDDEVARVIDMAHAHFIYDLPWGLETRIGEQGITLSGGQRQRLALARAILFHPRVLVLDDPLSALDVSTEAAVHKELRRTLTNTTTIITAHRPSTVALADRVAFLEDGRITAIGTHSQLLATVPGYREVLGRGAEELV